MGPQNNDITGAAPAAPAPQLLGEMGDHTLIPLRRDDANRSKVQRKCIICSRVRKMQTKSSYRCSTCVIRAVMCAPTTGQNCCTIPYPTWYSRLIHKILIIYGYFQRNRDRRRIECLALLEFFYYFKEFLSTKKFLYIPKGFICILIHLLK